MTTVSTADQLLEQPPTPPPPRRRRNPVVRFVGWLLLFVAVVVLLVVLVAGTVFGVTAIRVWSAGQVDAAADHGSANPVDSVLVLGASQYNGRPSELFETRLDHARALYQRQASPRVLTVGGKRAGDQFTEAAAGRNWLIAHGVPGSAVVAVGDGANTLESLRAAKAVYAANGWRSVVLVTDPWHCLRARSMAKDLGMVAGCSPVTTGPSVSSTWTKMRYIARESLAYLYYEVFRDDSAKGPAAI